jgi:hypothetical protein
VFYIGANNQYDIHLIEVNSDVYNKTYVSDPSYDLIAGEAWTSIYQSSTVSYGTLVLAVDEYRSEVENKTKSGKPEKWPNVPTDVVDAWSQAALSWNLTAPFNHELGNQSFISNITATGSISKEWIRFDWLFAQSSTNRTSRNIPKFARVPHAFAKRLDTVSRIQLSLTFLTIVIVCNSVKLLTMLWVVFAEQRDYLVTLGDGAASFLERPDPTTERMCILSKPEIVREVADKPHKIEHNDQLSRFVTQSEKLWVKQYTTYSNALNTDREIGSYFM